VSATCPSAFTWDDHANGGKQDQIGDGGGSAGGEGAAGKDRAGGKDWGRGSLLGHGDCGVAVVDVEDL
jgi:hypothetical protein